MYYECIKLQGVSICLLPAQEGPVALKNPDGRRVISSLTYHYSTGERTEAEYEQELTAGATDSYFFQCFSQSSSGKTVFFVQQGRKEL